MLLERIVKAVVVLLERVVLLRAVGVVGGEWC
jgi:hypothetical protein